MLKGRDVRLPVSLMVHSVEQIKHLYGRIPVNYQELPEKLLPGPVTILVESRIKDASPISEYLPMQTSGIQKVGFRIPENELCLQLTRTMASPISSTSANISGKDNALSIQEVHCCLRACFFRWKSKPRRRKYCFSRMKCAGRM